MTPFEDALGAALFRRSCPNSLDLVRYYDGALAAEMAAPIDRHLEICAHCQDELHRLNAARRAGAPARPEPAPAPGLGERVRIWIGRLLPPAGALQPAMALRGQGARTYDVGGRSLQVDIQPDRSQPRQRTIVGRLTGGKGDPAVRTAFLMRAGETAGAGPIQAGGQFILRGVAPAAYRLILAGEGIELHIPDLDLTGG